MSHREHHILLILTASVVTSIGSLTSGCATKKYARNTMAPIQAKIDQVGGQSAENAQSIEEIRKQLKDVDDRAQSGINAAQERASTADQHAMSADQRASEAMREATEAAQLADKNLQGINQLRRVISNIDDYRLQTSVIVPFGFDKYRLTEQAKRELEKLADRIGAEKRFVVAVEGHTDRIGTAEYNKFLSRRRADSVVEYLVGHCDIPIYRIYGVGLGEMKPITEGKTRDANAKSRRVEVKLYSADHVTTSLANTSRISTADRRTEGPNR